MSSVVNIQFFIVLLLNLLALIGALFAVFHAVRTRPDAFPAANKLSKPLWLGILAVAIMILLVTTAVASFLGLVAVVAVIVYIVDAKPKLDEVQRPRY